MIFGLEGLENCINFFCVVWEPGRVPKLEGIQALCSPGPQAALLARRKVRANGLGSRNSVRWFDDKVDRTVIDDADLGVLNTCFGAEIAKPAQRVRPGYLISNGRGEIETGDRWVQKYWYPRRMPRGDDLCLPG